LIIQAAQVVHPARGVLVLVEVPASLEKDIGGIRTGSEVADVIVGITKDRYVTTVSPIRWRICSPASARLLADSALDNAVVTLFS